MHLAMFFTLWVIHVLLHVQINQINSVILFDRVEDIP